MVGELTSNNKNIDKNNKSFYYINRLMKKLIGSENVR